VDYLSEIPDGHCVCRDSECLLALKAHLDFVIVAVTLVAVFSGFVIVPFMPIGLAMSVVVIMIMFFASLCPVIVTFMFMVVSLVMEMAAASRQNRAGRH